MLRASGAASSNSFFSKSGSSPGKSDSRSLQDQLWIPSHPEISNGLNSLPTASVLLSAPATPEKRKRGKCMSRRSQVGNVEVSGKWYVVRFWKDVPGQENRVHACERICPIEGPGTLSKAERKRKALEIVSSSGVNNPAKFIEINLGVTFREQAEQFMNQSVSRRRRPIKAATVSSWQNCLRKWLNPHFGEMPLANINNAAMKTLVATMHAKGLSPKSIVNYTGLVKLVVASAVDDNGEPKFPRRWNHDFIDMPIVANQRQPTFSAEAVTSIVKNAGGQERILYALLAGTGLRVGEALGLELGEHISEDCRTLYIRQSAWAGKTQTPKTESAKRDVDLCSALTELLAQFVGDRNTGFLFASRNGNVLSQSNVLRRHLHPLLKQLGVPKAGFHSFRRFRATFLSKSQVPDALVRFWLGHANKGVTDEYIKMADELDFRKEVAERIGTGFELFESPIVRNVRRNNVEAEPEIAV